MAWPPNGDMNIPKLRNRCCVLVGHSEVGDGLSSEPGSCSLRIPQNTTETTINEVQAIPMRLRCDKISSLTKLKRKNRTLIMILKKSLSTPVKALKESAKMIIIEIPALKRSMVNVEITTRWAALPKEY
jgi:hypothetical protein